MNCWTILNYSKVFWISFAKKWGTARTTRNSLTYPICQCPVAQPVTTFIFYLLLQLTEAGLATWNKDKQKLHDRHASHKTNHTTTRNTRETKATLLVHCWCLLVSSGLFWCLCSLTLGLICMACLASWHLHSIPMDFITS